MNEDMSDIMNKINNMMKNNDIPEDIKNLINSISNGSDNNSNNNSVKNEDNTQNPNNSSNIDPEMFIKISHIMNAMKSNSSNPRANLLRSLKPYLNSNRQEKVEQYIQLFNIEKVIEFMNNGGEKNDL